MTVRIVMQHTPDSPVIDREFSDDTAAYELVLDIVEMFDQANSCWECNGLGQVWVTVESYTGPPDREGAECEMCGGVGVSPFGGLHHFQIETYFDGHPGEDLIGFFATMKQGATPRGRVE